MVDRDVVLRKSEAIEHHTSRLRAKLPLQATALDADESLRNDLAPGIARGIDPRTGPPGLAFRAMQLWSPRPSA